MIRTKCDGEERNVVVRSETLQRGETHYGDEL